MLVTILLTLAAAVLIYFYTQKAPKKRNNAPGDAVFITGCDTGFGNILAKRLDASGYCVFATCLTDESTALLDSQTSKNVVTIQCDVTKQEDVDRAHQRVLEISKEKLWSVYSIVNNAGINAGFHFDFTDIEDFEKVFKVNLFGAIRVTKKFMPMLKKKKGRVINISSILGLCASPLVTVYGSAKFALDGFSRSLRIDMKPFGVKVILLNPGGFDTAILNKAGEQMQPYFDRHPELHEEYGDKYMQKVVAASKRYPLGNPKLVVDALMVALTSENPRPRYIVGADAQLLRFVAMLPDTLYDWLQESFVRLPKPYCTLKNK